MARQSIGFVEHTWEVNKCVIVVSKAWQVTGDLAVDVLGVVVIFKIFVVSVDSDRVGGADKEVSPVLQATH